MDDQLLMTAWIGLGGAGFGLLAAAVAVLLDFLGEAESSAAGPAFLAGLFAAAVTAAGTAPLFGTGIMPFALGTALYIYMFVSARLLSLGLVAIAALWLPNEGMDACAKPST